jgi:hypothetical protein
LHQFRVLAAQANLLHQVADGPRRPQPGDEILTAFVAEGLIGVGEGLLAAIGRAGQRDRRRAAVAVAPGDDQLRAREQIG